MIKIIQLTDLHFVASGLLFRGLDPAKRLRQVLDHISWHQADAAAILLTGDLVHSGDVESYKLLRDVLARVDIPAHMTIGNHDDRETFRSVFGGEGYVQETVDIENWRIILLDTKLDGEDKSVPYGSLDKERLEWLENKLAEAVNRSVLLALHHPPHDLHQPFLSGLGLVRPGSFLDVVRKFDNVRHMIFGHMHLAAAGSFSRIPFTVNRGTTYQVEIDFEQLGKPTLYAPPAAYDVICLDGQNVVVHSQVGSLDFPVVSKGSSQVTEGTSSTV